MATGHGPIRLVQAASRADREHLRNQPSNPQTSARRESMSSLPSQHAFSGDGLSRMASVEEHNSCICISQLATECVKSHSCSTTGSIAGIPNVASTIRVKLDKKDTKNTTGLTTFWGRSTGTCPEATCETDPRLDRQVGQDLDALCGFGYPSHSEWQAALNKINSNGFSHRS